MSVPEEKHSQEHRKIKHYEWEPGENNNQGTEPKA